MSSNQITVLIFKDNYVARTFKVPLKWISRLGVLGLSWVAITLFLGLLALKFYLASTRHHEPLLLNQVSQDPVKIEASNPLPEVSTLAFHITDPTLQWNDRTLHVQFSIQYNGLSGGNQQGRIALIAHGPEMILGYPKTILNFTENGPLIVPKQGEFFSVSRFREVHANFTVPSERSQIHEIEIFIYHLSNQLLFKRKLIATTELENDPQKE